MAGRRRLDAPVGDASVEDVRVAPEQVDLDRGPVREVGAVDRDCVRVVFGHLVRQIVEREVVAILRLGRELRDLAVGDVVDHQGRVDFGLGPVAPLELGEEPVPRFEDVGGVVAVLPDVQLDVALEVVEPVAVDVVKAVIVGVVEARLVVLFGAVPGRDEPRRAVRRGFVEDPGIDPVAGIGLERDAGLLDWGRRNDGHDVDPVGSSPEEMLPDEREVIADRLDQVDKQESHLTVDAVADALDIDLE